MRGGGELRWGVARGIVSAGDTGNEPPLQTRYGYIGYHYHHWQFYNAT